MASQHNVPFWRSRLVSNASQLLPGAEQDDGLCARAGGSHGPIPRGAGALAGGGDSGAASSLLQLPEKFTSFQ